MPAKPLHSARREAIVLRPLHPQAGRRDLTLLRQRLWAEAAHRLGK